MEQQQVAEVGKLKKQNPLFCDSQPKQLLQAQIFTTVNGVFHDSCYANCKLHWRNRVDCLFRFVFNPLKPNDSYSGRSAPLTSKVAFYIFIQQI
jgi:hypothetical protein